MSTYHNVIKQAELKAAANDVSVSSVKLLMYELTQQTGIDLYFNYHETIDPDIHNKFNRALERLFQQEPLAYILGYQWFYGRKITVNPDVFIPRYETEELCSYILKAIDEYFPDYPRIEVADIATGSGAIAVTLSCEEPRIHCYATELSAKALQTAQQNAADNQAEVNFYQGDMLNPLIKQEVRVDILVSNPPYIGSQEVLDHSVVDFEPNMALFGGDDGLRFYKVILSDAKKLLKERSMMAFEIGYDQKDALLKLVHELYPDQPAEVIKDLNGKDRMLFVYLNLCK
ncbi:MAG: peptide chain release factor N(5)-glutamine methyltransferase [Erysipelotrichaceae bacterium]|nr:peptide chain release factor N(5)-glutamine methyltransferase [Erysipelotrichaceae bacterium]